MERERLITSIALVALAFISMSLVSSRANVTAAPTGTLCGSGILTFSGQTVNVKVCKIVSSGSVQGQIAINTTYTGTTYTLTLLAFQGRSLLKTLSTEGDWCWYLNGCWPPGDTHLTPNRSLTVVLPPKTDTVVGIYTQQAYSVTVTA